MHSVVVAAILFGVGCGKVNNNGPADASDAPINDGAIDPNEGVRSGTRLKLQWQDFGGTKTYASLLDTQRSESCNVNRWSDGNLYCTPIDTASSVYANASCTQVVAQIYRPTAGCVPHLPAYVYEYDVTSCDFGLKSLYPVGTKSTASQYWQQSPDGTCNGPYPTGTSYDYYQVGPAIPSSSFVRFHVEPPSSNLRLSQLFYSATDGARVRGYIRDAELKTDCYLSSPYPGAPSVSCVPLTARYTNYFHDGACTAAEVGDRSVCPKPQLAVQPVNGACQYSPLKYFSVGAPVASSPLYFKTATCQATTPTADLTFYSVGQEVTLASLARTPDTIPGRTIELIHDREDPNASAFRDYAQYDVAHNTECNRTNVDGTTRCLPNATPINDYFSDANCTQTIALMDVYNPPGCTPVPVTAYGYKFLAPTGTQCEYQREYWSVGSLYSQPVYRKLATCQPASSDYIRYRITVMHPLSEFSAADFVTDN